MSPFRQMAPVPLEGATERVLAEVDRRRRRWMLTGAGAGALVALPLAGPGFILVPVITIMTMVGWKIGHTLAERRRRRWISELAARHQASPEEVAAILAELDGLQASDLLEDLRFQQPRLGPRKPDDPDDER